jgi:hypothetical protein
MPQRRRGASSCQITRRSWTLTPLGRTTFYFQAPFQNHERSYIEVGWQRGPCTCDGCRFVDTAGMYTSERTEMAIAFTTATAWNQYCSSSCAAPRQTARSGFTGLPRARAKRYRMLHISAPQTADGVARDPRCGCPAAESLRRYHEPRDDELRLSKALAGILRTKSTTGSPTPSVTSRTVRLHCTPPLRKIHGSLRGSSFRTGRRSITGVAADVRDALSAVGVSRTSKQPRRLPRRPRSQS